MCQQLHHKHSPGRETKLSWRADVSAQTTQVPISAARQGHTPSLEIPRSRQLCLVAVSAAQHLNGLSNTKSARRTWVVHGGFGGLLAADSAVCTLLRLVVKQDLARVLVRRAEQRLALSNAAHCAGRYGFFSPGWAVWLRFPLGVTHETEAHCCKKTSRAIGFLPYSSLKRAPTSALLP